MIPTTTAAVPLLDPALRHIALDLETLSLGNNPVIIAIGATRFDPATGETLDSFYVNVDPEDCQRYGLEISASTVAWWMAQSSEARQAVLDKDVMLDLPNALVAFAEWATPGSYDEDDDDRKRTVIYGYGAKADNAWLENAYKRAGILLPWTYKTDLCGRTLAVFARWLGVDLDNVPAREGAVAHNALDDSQWLADRISYIYQTMKCSTNPPQTNKD